MLNCQRPLELTLVGVPLTCGLSRFTMYKPANEKMGDVQPRPRNPKHQ